MLSPNVVVSVVWMAETEAKTMQTKVDLHNMKWKLLTFWDDSKKFLTASIGN